MMTSGFSSFFPYDPFLQKSNDLCPCFILDIMLCSMSTKYFAKLIDLFNESAEIEGYYSTISKLMNQQFLY